MTQKPKTEKEQLEEITEIEFDRLFYEAIDAVREELASLYKNYSNIKNYANSGKYNIKYYINTVDGSLKYVLKKKGEVGFKR